MAAQTATGVEFEEAVRLLTEGGFSNSRALDLLCKRHELRDKFAMAALTGFVSRLNCATGEDYLAAVEGAFLMADRCLVERMK